MITFHIPAVPDAQPRQRHAIIAGHVRNYTPARHPVNAFKAAMQLALRDAYDGPPLDGPLYLDVIFVLPRRAVDTRKTKPNPRLMHPRKPDVDNLLKSLKDALTGLAWRDDSQVSTVHAVKCYASGNEQPHVEVEVTQLGVTDV